MIEPTGFEKGGARFSWVGRPYRPRYYLSMQMSSVETRGREPCFTGVRITAFFLEKLYRKRHLSVSEAACGLLAFAGCMRAELATASPTVHRCRCQSATHTALIWNVWGRVPCTEQYGAQTLPSKVTLIKLRNRTTCSCEQSVGSR